MTTPMETAAGYIALWNEREEGRRAALLDEKWSAEATYVDPLARVAGRSEISNLIGAVQAQYPEFRFRPLGAVDGHNEFARFSWGFGPEGAEPVAKGTDIVRLHDGLIASVIGFLDFVPAPSP